jgi:CRISPR system Cascade subunit CasE
MTAFLSRARLKKDASLAALAPLLIPEMEGARIGAAHRLVWSLFADGPDRRRDFLWHEETPGSFLILSARPPCSEAGLFDIETKRFEPALSSGDHLSFFLRANAVFTTAKPDARGRRRHDVVMASIHGVPNEARAEERATALGWSGSDATAVPLAWLARQGGASGFTIGQAAVLAYRQVSIPHDETKGRRRDDVRFSTVDLEGEITIVEPERFTSAVLRGFGKAKAFGCGLMLIRRAR